MGVTADEPGQHQVAGEAQSARSRWQPARIDCRDPITLDEQGDISCQPRLTPVPDQRHARFHEQRSKVGLGESWGRTRGSGRQQRPGAAGEESASREGIILHR